MDRCHRRKVPAHDGQCRAKPGVPGARWRARNVSLGYFDRGLLRPALAIAPMAGARVSHNAIVTTIAVR